jgi:hypothetical protein
MFTIKALIAIVLTVAGIAVSGSRPSTDTPVSAQAQHYPNASFSSVFQAMVH